MQAHATQTLHHLCTITVTLRTFICLISLAMNPSLHPDCPRGKELWSNKPNRRNLRTLSKLRGRPASSLSKTSYSSWSSSRTIKLR